MKTKSIFLLLFCLLTLFINSCILFKEKPVEAKNGMVVSASENASKVGVEILKNGGNAIDAAVATGFALAVTYPQAGNIGGGGFMVIHLANDKNTTIDYREKAPLKAFRDMYLDSAGNFIPELSQTGVTSVGVPGSVSGMLYALEKYGTMKLENIIQHAIDLAKKGWILDKWNIEQFNYYFSEFKKYPSSNKIFTNKGNHFKEGDNFTQPDLASTFELIKKNGIDGFYKGKIADFMIKQIDSMGGYITQTDLDNYKPVEREPVIGTYRGYKIVSMPPPSSGGIALIEMLNILENYSFNQNEWNTIEYVHKLVEAMKYTYADRTKYLGDPDFYPIPKNELISKKYAKTIFDLFHKAKTSKIKVKATPSEEISHGKFINYKESTETTHFSVYDKYGNAVSVTTTLNSSFGSRIVVDGSGFLLNNEMDDFSSKPGEPNIYGLLGSEANSIQPGKRMLSSMTPTIVLKNDKPYLIVGSPGGSQIITSVLQTIINVLDFNMDIKQAVDAPRFHHQWLPDKIFYEKDTFSNQLKNELALLGYSFEEEKLDKRKIGMLAAIMIEKNSILGAFDKRGPGKACGY
ncbi:MAG: gamma-glutamyltransferase [Ignavibacteriales bacterium CG_4_9_14_3_um_filter_30_11]|nr:MAG: gamma-glutamyltransferase [Ignavibacteriales bacterium CG_4_9_14_3_um_filter_30_11]